MRLVQIQDALRRYYDLEAPPNLTPPAGIFLVQDVDKLQGGRIGNTYAYRTSVSAAAGEYQAISLLRPASLTGMDVEITEVHILNSTAGQLVYFGRGSSTTYTDRGAGYNLDQRGQAYRSGARLVDESSAAPLIATVYGQLLPNNNYHGPWKCSMFIPAGGLITFRTNAVNQGISGMIVWRETPVTQVK